MDSYWTEEMILSVMAIVTERRPDAFTRSDLPSAEVFADAARSLLMLKLANGSVTVKILQALCLLSFYNYISTFNLVEPPASSHSWQQEVSTSPCYMQA